MRISTYGQHQTLVQYMTGLQGRVADAQIKQASGLNSSSLSGLEGQTKTLLNLEGELTRSAGYIANGDAAIARLNSTYAAMQGVNDIATRSRGLTISYTDATDLSGVRAQAQGMLEDLAATLNQPYAGQYLFSGTATNTKPVDLAQLSAAGVPSTADTAYYQGDGGSLSAKIADNQTVGYGVGADDPAIEALVRSLNILANADPLDQAALTEAGTLAEQAASGTATILETLSSQSSRIQDVVDGHTDVQLYAESWISDIREVDVVAVQTQLSMLETSLEATMQAIATFQRLSLADYL
jgi:flagellar hook-associated protein 3 FlgL